MKIRIGNIRAGLWEDHARLLQRAAKRLQLNPKLIKELKIVKEAVDARKKDDIKLVYTVECHLRSNVQLHEKVCQDTQVQVLVEQPSIQLSKGSQPMEHRPIVVGAGPCGYFAALLLAEYGYKPLLLERGFDVDTRAKHVSQFWETGKLHLNSNVQYGEGGAGTFSDGKLTTRIHDPRMGLVTKWLVEAGAPEEIAYRARPHVGTDLLRIVVKNLRNKLISLGGEVRFGHLVQEIVLEKSLIGRKIAGVKASILSTENGAFSEEVEIPSKVVVLAIGHSARDTFQMLYQHEVEMVPKAFAIGVRVEHPQQLINQAQYGGLAEHPRLGVADYQLHYRAAKDQRTVFSFCMCPGGTVVAAASEKGGVVTNGMSAYARDTGTANSALVVSVEPEDFPIPGPLGGLEFQRIWEQAAYQAGGGGYKAPAQTVGDFLSDTQGDIDDAIVNPTYRPGVTAANLRQCLPKEVSETLAVGLKDFGRKIQGFDLPKAVLTGVETRTSSPCRVLRDDSFQSPGTSGLYPAGEGAGYAGGIVSAAVDGLRVAEAIIGTWKL